MRTYICQHCNARNTHTGQCVSCLKSLGSVKKAIDAALLSGAILVTLWVGLSWITGMQFTFFAMLFGGLISLAVTRYSGGAGFLYQAIATAATIMSILVADALVVILFWDTIYGSSGVSAPSFSMDFLEYQFNHDPYTFYYVTIGVLGGFYIWHNPSNA